ncbi:hypothetical protein JCM16358_04700 [Halanaerocella petrolearia]
MFENSKVKKWLLFIGGFLLIFSISAGVTYYFKFYHQSGFSIDPQVEIDSENEYQITYWDYPLFIGQDNKYHKFLQKSIAEFNNRYPNININYKLLSFLKGRKKLNQALEIGSPPDIYHGVFGRKLIDSKLQIPVSLFLSQEKKANYSSLAKNAFSYQEQIWGLPNWLLPEVWVGNKSLLTKGDLDVKGITRQGWTIDQLLEVVTKLKELDKDNNIIFNPYNGRLLQQLLTIRGRDNLVSQEKTLAITTEDLESIFQMLDKLQEKNAFPRNKAKMNKRLLSNLWANKAGIIAPVNMWLLNSLYQQSKNQQVRLTLLPIPTFDSSKREVPISVTGLLLFRQEEYQGDDHTKAVYKFAKFMNQQQSLYISKKLNVVPAYLPLQSTWQKEVKLKTDIKEQLMTYISRGNSRKLTGFANEKLELKLREKLADNYQNYWLNDPSSQEVVDSIWEDSQQIIENNTEQEEKAEGE